MKPGARGPEARNGPGRGFGGERALTSSVGDHLRKGEGNRKWRLTGHGVSEGQEDLWRLLALRAGKRGAGPMMRCGILVWSGGDAGRGGTG